MSDVALPLPARGPALPPPRQPSHPTCTPRGSRSPGRARRARAEGRTAAGAWAAGCGRLASACAGGGVRSPCVPPHARARPTPATTRHAGQSAAKGAVRGGLAGRQVAGSQCPHFCVSHGRPAPKTAPHAGGRRAAPARRRGAPAATLASATAGTGGVPRVRGRGRRATGPNQKVVLRHLGFLGTPPLPPLGARPRGCGGSVSVRWRGPKGAA